MRTLKRVVATLALSALSAAGAAAQSFPDRPITLIVPNAAGGPTDFIARAVAQKLSARLGQSIVVDNRAGAAGVIGTDTVARAKPDGYTLLFSTANMLAINPALNPKLRYNADKDFEYVGLVSTSQNVFVVRDGLGVTNLKEFIALAKREPGKLNYGSSGIGSSGHLTAELLMSMTGIKLTHIPFKSMGTSRLDFSAGRTDISICTDDSACKEFVASVKAHPIMVTGKQRSPLFTDVPTADEAGLKGYDVTIWFGLNAPRSTPKPVIDTLNKALNEVLDSPETRKEFASNGQVIRLTSSEEYRAFAAKDRQRWAEIIKASNIRAD